MNLRDELEAFVTERDWQQFHTPENLAKSISIEAGELLECFQWGSSSSRDDIVSEVADVLIYAHHLCRILDVEPEEIMREKLKVAAIKYPVSSGPIDVESDSCRPASTFRG